MKYDIQFKPIGYVKSHAAEIVREPTERREPLPITQDGEAKQVVIDVLGDEKQEQPIALLQLLAHGRRDIKEGRVVPAADVFAQIEAMDRENAE